MWKQFYMHSTLLDLPLWAMFLFMITFALAVGRALGRHGKDAPDARLPLDEDGSPSSRSTP